ncbi:MAG: DegV family protein [Clostridiales bacterium]|nr:DegV family protein [Clostridiales bacterium]
MNNFIITTETTCDLPDSYLTENNIDIFSLDYKLEDIIYSKDNSLKPKDFYAKMRAGSIPTTNAIIPEIAKETFKRYTDQGLAVLHIGFSSGLSGSYANAALAANEVIQENPDAKIIFIDSLCASLGEGLLVYKAVELRSSGKTIDETAKWVEENKLHICHQFTVDDLNHLHRGGRVSKATAIIGTLVSVKPVLHVDDEGHLTPLSNVRGRKKSLITLVDNMEKSIGNYKNDIVFISHGDSLEDAQYVAELIKERFGITKSLINYVSPTIGAHSGPGTIALFYMGEKR